MRRIDSTLPPGDPLAAGGVNATGAASIASVESLAGSAETAKAASVGTSAAAPVAGGIDAPSPEAKKPRVVDACALAIIAIQMAQSSREANSVSAAASSKLALQSMNDAANKIRTAAYLGLALGLVSSGIQFGTAAISIAGAASSLKGLKDGGKGAMKGETADKLAEKAEKTAAEATRVAEEAGESALEIASEAAEMAEQAQSGMEEGVEMRSMSLKGNAIEKNADAITMRRDAERIKKAEHSRAKLEKYLPRIEMALGAGGQLVGTLKETLTGNMHAASKSKDALAQQYSDEAHQAQDAAKAQADAIRTFLTVINDMMKAEADRANLAARA